MGARGKARSDDVPHALDAAANGRDQDFQLDGVREGSAELGVAPIRAKSLVVDLGRAAVAIGQMSRRRLGGAEEFSRQGERSRRVGVVVPGRTGPNLGVTGSAAARPGAVMLEPVMVAAERVEVGRIRGAACVWVMVVEWIAMIEIAASRRLPAGREPARRGQSRGDVADRLRRSVGA